MKKVILLLILSIFTAGCATLGFDEQAKAKNSQGGNRQVTEIENRHAMLVTPEQTEIIKIKPKRDENYDAVFEVADSLFDSKRYEEAKKLYRQIIDEDAENPKVPFCFYNIGLIDIKLMQWESAVENFTGAAERLSGRETFGCALMLLAVVLVQLPEKKSAASA